MLPHILVAGLASIATTASALGINCRGSSRCNNGIMQHFLYQADHLDPNRWYQNNQKIMCQLYEDVFTSGAFCLFLQNTGGVPGSSIKPLVQALSDHGCKGCGSVPVFYPQGDNNPDHHGILTLNFVSDPGRYGCGIDQDSAQLCP